MTIWPNAIYRFNVIPIKLPMTFFKELEQKYFTIHMEAQKASNTQSSLKKEDGSWRNQPSWLQVILQGYSHQDSMVLAQKQKYRPMEQDRKPRINPSTFGYLISDKCSKNMQLAQSDLHAEASGKCCWSTCYIVWLYLYNSFYCLNADPYTVWHRVLIQAFRNSESV